jgi:hypothetical protein
MSTQLDSPRTCPVANFHHAVGRFKRRPVLPQVIKLLSYALACNRIRQPVGTPDS